MGNSKAIDEGKVKHVAQLARLQLSDEELQIFTKQLGDILEYMDILNKVKTEKVEPTYQVLDGTENISREDKVRKSFSQIKAVEQANFRHQGYFAVKSVFSEGSPLLKNNKVPKRKIIDKFNAALTEVNSKGTVGHKDLFMTEGVNTTAGSSVLGEYIAHYNSTVVGLLEGAGHKTKYKLNQDAWGHGSSGENSDFGPTKNPWDTQRVAGGSSSGSGASIGSGMVKVATGTDTCGSIRMPASYCNATGIKPTYGALSRYGVIAFASSLDCPGLIAGSVSELRKYFDIVNKSDFHDATSQSRTREKLSRKKVKTIGIPKEMFSEGIDLEVKELVYDAKDKLESEGYKIKEVSLPHSKYGIAAYYIIAPTETSSNLARYDGVRYGGGRDKFGPEAKRRIMLGTYASSAGYSAKYYEKAAKVRTLIRNDFDKAFSGVDVILAPTSPIPPFKIGEKSADPLQLYLMDVYMAPGSLAGIPSLALPCGFSESGLPVGMQLMGPRWSEDSLFDLGEEYQKLTNWHTRKPNLKG